jgi:hypothetical protein
MGKPGQNKTVKKYSKEGNKMTDTAAKITQRATQSVCTWFKGKKAGRETKREEPKNELSAREKKQINKFLAAIREGKIYTGQLKRDIATQQLKRRIGHINRLGSKHSHVAGMIWPKRYYLIP